MPALMQKIILLLLFSSKAFAVSQDLAYPSAGQELTGRQLAEQIYYVNHLYAFETVEMDGKKNQQIRIYNYQPGKKPTLLLASRYVNHRMQKENIKTMDMVTFNSGKQRGVGVLVTDYRESGKPMSVSLWLPALRKVRRITEPNHDDIWAGSILTYGDIYLRRPDEETHEILGREEMQDCLGTMIYAKDDWSDDALPEADCSVKGKPVYLLKSLHKEKNWWYDYRLRWVDTESFTDYQVHYFKDGQRIKSMSKSWYRLDADNPRAVLMHYWFARSDINGQQSFALVPVGAVKTNTGRSERFWSEATLRKIRR